ncbi:MAG TPA: KpsF/GutQ family sugar-phosphate isomerase [Chitinophagaceae bacterium]|nr:KpsF/GutQ family sugar-phosphate isomerase [Chitinophagaceae bacterium]
MDIQESAKKTIRLESQAIAQLEQYIRPDFEKAVRLIAEGKGRVVATGIGKSAIIAQKIVATLNSTGTPALFLHAGDAIHGDLGMVQQEDILLFLSKSGESPEIRMLVPLVRNLGNPLIAIVGHPNSFLAKSADIALNSSVPQEACPNNLAPTSSTTAQLVLGDAIAICLMELRGFSPEDFAKFHPGGSLGKKLYLRVHDLIVHNEMPRVLPSSPLREAILEITGKRLGITSVLDSRGKLVGVITDGDLRRMLEKGGTISSLCAADIMTRDPKTIQRDELAVNALESMRRHNITQLVVLDRETYAGIVHLHDLVREGII